MTRRSPSRCAEELKDTDVTVTCLVPGATDTEFFERADMMDGEGDVVSGWKNKLMSAAANVTPAETLAKQHRRMAEPGSAKH